VGVAERHSRVRPQGAVPDPAGCARLGLLDRRRVEQPGRQVGPGGAFPPLVVRLAHPGPGDAVSAVFHLAGGVRQLPAPPWVRRRREQVNVGSAMLDPAQVMPRTHSLPPGRTGTAVDAAGAAAEDRVGRSEEKHISAELEPDRAYQPLGQQGLLRRRSSRRQGGRHSRTPAWVNHPTCSSVRRASSTLRCPYTSKVIVTLAWPRSLLTTSTGVPARRSLVA